MDIVLENLLVVLLHFLEDIATKTNLGVGRRLRARWLLFCTSLFKFTAALTCNVFDAVRVRSSNHNFS